MSHGGTIYGESESHTGRSTPSPEHSSSCSLYMNMHRAVQISDLNRHGIWVLESND